MNNLLLQLQDLPLPSFQKKICEKNIRTEAKTFLNEIKLDKIINERIFLSIFLMYFFSNDFLDKNDAELHHMSKTIIEHSENRRKNIMDFNISFKKWLGEDLTTLKSQLLQEYHQLSVQILNTSNEEEKNFYQEVQKELLESAKLIKYDQEILEYVPIVIDKEKLSIQYKQAFIDVIEQNLKLKKFDHLQTCIQSIIDCLCMLHPRKKEEILQKINVDFLKQQLEHDAFSKNDEITFFLYIYQCLKEVHSPVHDQEVDNFIENVSSISFSKHLFFILSSLDRTIEEIQNLNNIVHNKNT